MLRGLAPVSACKKLPRKVRNLRLEPIPHLDFFTQNAFAHISGFVIAEVTRGYYDRFVRSDLHLLESGACHDGLHDLVAGEKSGRCLTQSHRFPRSLLQQ